MVLQTVDEVTMDLTSHEENGNKCTLLLNFRTREKFLGHILKKEGLEILTPTEHMEDGQEKAVNKLYKM